MNKRKLGALVLLLLAFAGIALANFNLVGTGLILITAVALAMALSCLPAYWPHVIRFWRDAAGTATVTYGYPVPAGTTQFITTPPTTALAALVNRVEALIQWVDADTVATVTHNFQVYTTFTFPFPNAALYQPDTNLTYISYTTGAPAALYIGSFLTNTIVVNKTNLASTAGTVLCVMHRPGSVNY